MQAYLREPYAPSPMKYTNGISRRSQYTPPPSSSPRKNIVDLRLLLIYTILCGDYENEEGIA